MRTQIFAIHGFLGQPSDWADVFHFIREEQPTWELIAVDLLTESGLTPNQALEDWGKNFNAYAKSKGPADRRTIVGYSMGGRLALHAVHANIEFWQSAVFLSTHPGLSSANEKLQRLQSDRIWAARFSQESIESVLLDWNKQGVFSGRDSHPVRDLHLLRQKLVQCLENWSLGKQRNFREEVDLWQLRQFWIAGEKDQKFADLLKSLPLVPEIQKWIVGDAFHRLLQEAPEEVGHFIVRATLPPVPGEPLAT